MTREEAIQIVQKLLKTNRLDGTGLSQVWDFLKQPVTLADFLGWEDGQEYEWRGDIFRIQSDILQVYDKEDEMWFDSSEELNDYLRLRQAKKVEQPKLKAYHVKDEYSFDSLIKELVEKGYTKTLGGYLTIKTNYYMSVKETTRNYIYLHDNDSISFSHELVRDGYDLIEYHKEEPKYKWRFKSVKTIRIDGKVLYFHHAEDCDLILDSYPNVRYMTEKLLREELRGTRFNVADFERVE